MRLAVDRDDFVLHRSHGENRDLRRIEDGDEALDPVHAEIGDREGAVREVVLLQLPPTRTFDELRTGVRDFLHGQPLT